MRCNILLALILGGFFFIGCERNQVPQILEVSYSPEFGSGGTVFLISARVVDENHYPAEYLWSCDRGQFCGEINSEEVKWIAPRSISIETYSITVNVSVGKKSTSKITHIQIDNPDNENFQFTDPRDGHKYLAFRYGDQTWMVENLAYLPKVSPSARVFSGGPEYYVYGYEGDNITKAKAYSNYEKYGVLYSYSAARISCPDGWHLPAIEEWRELIDYMIDKGYGYGGLGDQIAKSMAAASGWDEAYLDESIGSKQERNNSSGFNTPPGGFRSVYGGYANLGETSYFWSSSLNYSFVWACNLDNYSSSVFIWYFAPGYGFSVRCLMNQ